MIPKQPLTDQLYDLADLATTMETQKVIRVAAARIRDLQEVLFMLLDDIELGEGPSEFALEWANKLRRAGEPYDDDRTREDNR